MKTVLVVDDEPFVAQVIGLAFEDYGFQVVYAANGEQGLARLAEAVPDIIITDHMMPVLDGPAMVHRIRAEPALNRVPIVLMSAIPPLPSLEKACPGAQGFLQKPFRLDQVVGLVETLLAGRSGD